MSDSKTKFSMLASLSQALASATEAPGQGLSHLARARQVAGSMPVQNGSTENAEFEGAEWWEEHAELFAAARAEWGVLHPELFDLEASAESFIDPRLLRAVSALERAAAVGGEVDESELRSLFTPAAKGVWRFPLFTPLFCEKMLDELRHAEASGVPLRRPNGMNRFGAILEDVPGGVSFNKSLSYLTRRHLRPLSQMLFPWLVAAGDADEHYGFVVRYKPGEDVSLAQVRETKLRPQPQPRTEPSPSPANPRPGRPPRPQPSSPHTLALILAQHADASVATLNVNLGERGFQGGALTFRGVRFVDAQPQAQPASRVDFAQFAPGEAVLHLGGQYHAAEPTTEGCRINLIVWLFGAHGVVRVAPYDEPGQLQPQQRWSAAATEQAAAAMAAPSWAAAKSTCADAPAREEDPEGEDVVDQAAHDEL